MCLIFGIPSVEEAKQRISDEQFWEWMALDQVDPLPDPWWQHAKLCQLVEAVATGKGKPMKDYTPLGDGGETKLESVHVHKKRAAAERGNAKR